MAISLPFERVLAIVSPSGVTGDAPAVLTGIAALGEAGPGDLSFLGNAKYKGDVPASKAGVILLPEDYVGEPAPGQAFVRVQNPSFALALIGSEIEAALWPRPAAGVHASAVVDPSAKIGAGVHVGPLCVIEAGAVIGDNTVIEARGFIGRHARVGRDCWLKPGVVVSDYCVLGDRVRIQSGAVIGSDGFGYETMQGQHVRVPQVGAVVLEDDVEIGANTTLDRARFSVTRVGKGSKIDNLVQIAHNVVIGRHCIIVGQVGIAGSTVLEDYVVLGGQVGLAGHIRLGKGARIGAQAGVLADVEPGAVLLDAPAIPFGLAKKLMVLKMRLPDLFKKVDSLEKQVEALSGTQASR